jgi:vancomycin resistance protein YoaR
MSSFINGGVMQPGGEWTINTVAGPRNSSTAKTIGWKKAAGIENGGYTAQYGGGVCQLGSTTFNAALRAGITIVSSTHHTIPSDYIPLGLDATLSTPKPDLVLKNDNTMPVYIVSYVNPKDKNVTVEIYGQQPIDPTYGAVIYDYTSNNRGSRYGTPVPKVITSEVPITAPDGTVVDASNPNYVYAKSRKGTSIQTYKHIYSLDGKELCDPIPFEKHNYPVQNGTTYVYSPPVVVTPTPAPSDPSPTPTASESAG